MASFGIQIGLWAFIRVWVFNRIFTVHVRLTALMKQNSIYAVTNIYHVYGSHGIMKVSANLQDERTPEKILLYSLVQAMSMKIALTST